MPSIFGLDLGQTSDPTALAGLEQTTTAGGESCYAVRFLRRYELGTSYPKIVADVHEVMAGHPNTPLVVDQTGVGRPVVDMFRERPGLFLRPVTITGGQHAAKSDDGWRVPKKDLVGAVQALLSSRRLLIAKGLKESALLVAELQNFRVKITLAANETFGAWREGQHDDMVLAVALAAWLGERDPVWGADAFGLPAEDKSVFERGQEMGVWAT